MDGVQLALKRMFIDSAWNSFERYFVFMMVGYFITYNIAYGYNVMNSEYHFYSLSTISTNIVSLFIVPLALSIDVNFREKHQYKEEERLLFAELFVFNVLLLDVVLQLQYGLLVSFVDSTAINSDDLAVNTLWTFFAFCNKFWLSKLMKMFMYKVLFHDKCVRPPKCQRVPK